MSGPSAEHGVSPTGRSLARDPHKEETCCGKWSRKQQVFPKPTNILVVAAMGLVRADLHLVAAIYLVRGRGCCGLLSILILGLCSSVRTRQAPPLSRACAEGSVAARGNSRRGVHVSTSHNLIYDFRTAVRYCLVAEIQSTAVAYGTVPCWQLTSGVATKLSHWS